MNFTYRKTVAKQKELVSIQRKLTTKSLVTILKFSLFCVLFVVCFLTAFGVGVLKGIIDNAPDIKDVNIVPTSYLSTAYNSNGDVIATLVTAGSNRVKATIDEIPDNLQNAFIAIEDERFYDHNGIDVYGIGRAFVSVFKTKSLSQGASTITQQVIKNNVFTGWEGEQTYGSLIKRKIQEQYLAVQLEKVMDKKTILENYLNTINLGANTLGVQTASLRYFNKDVSDLDLAECSVIAAITQNPSLYNPITNPDENQIRRTYVLQYMLKDEYITQEEYDEAIKMDVYSRIQTIDANQSKRSIYSYFVDQLVLDILDDLQEQKGYTYTQAYNLLFSGGLSIYTTQDSTIQKICDKELSNDENYPPKISYSFNWAYTVVHADGTVENYSENSIKYYHKTILGEESFKLIYDSKKEIKQDIKRYKKYLYPKGLVEGEDTEYEDISFTKQPQASFSVIDQSTGYVKAIVGGRGKKNVSMALNRASQSTRQPGSTFKVLAVYAPAIDTMGYTLNTKSKDEPYNYANGRPVKNWWGNSYRGTVTIKQAIAQSMNIIAVKTITDITPQLGYEYLLDFGFTTLVDERVEDDGTVVSDITQALALGGITDGVTNLELTAAYAAIANNGIYNKPVLYTQVVENSGKILLDNTTPKSHKVIKASTAALLTEAMQDVVNGNGTGTPANVKDMHVAGKTGTTSNQYDLWFAGFTPYLTASVWTGYDENNDLGYDVFYHEELWSKIMTQIDEAFGYEDKDFEFDLSGDPDVVAVEVCKDSGLLPNGDACTETEIRYFSSDEVPEKKCNKHGVQYKETTKAEESDNNDDSGDDDSGDDE